MRIRVPLAIAALLSLAFAGTADARKAALDERLYATYSADGPPGTGFVVNVCGEVGNTSGCYGFGFMEPPFEQACALLEGSSKTNDNVMTRDIYVLDKRTSNANPPMLYVYTRTDTFSENSDTIDVALKKQITLDFIGGKKAKCFMAANDTTIYVASSASGKISMINKKTLTATSSDGAALVTSIAADDRGDIAIDTESGFGVIPYWNPDAGIGGGGAEYLSSTRNAWKP